MKMKSKRNIRREPTEKDLVNICLMKHCSHEVMSRLIYCQHESRRTSVLCITGNHTKNIRNEQICKVNDKRFCV